MIARRFFILLAAFVLMAGCSSRVGIQEFETYKKAFDESQSVSIAIIDQLAVAERRLRKERRLKELGRDTLEFDPDKDIEFSDLRDPPLANAYRRSLAVIGRYNSAMLAFATGGGFEESRSAAISLGNEVLQLADVIRGSTAIAAQFAPYVGLIDAFSKFALNQYSRQIFREELLRNHAAIESLLLELRNTTPDVFPFLARHLQNEIIAARLGNSKVDVQRLQAEKLKIRSLLADWVFLMDKNIQALRSVKRAVENNTSQTSFAGAREDLIALRMATESIRKNMAEIRAN